jgi:hypothetical protein
MAAISAAFGVPTRPKPKNFSPIQKNSAVSLETASQVGHEHRDFTIGYVASLLGEDEDWLFELSIGMEPEDGSLWVYGVGDDGVPAFTPRWHRQPARDHRRSKSLRKTTAS